MLLSFRGSTLGHVKLTQKLVPMKTNVGVDREAGFSKMDLLALVGVLFLLSVLAGPLFGNLSGRSDQVVCVNNLRLIGSAFLARSSELGERNPWSLTAPEGGTRGHPLHQSLWFQFLQISNYLESPRYFADLADGRVNTARRWTNNPLGGFGHPSFQNNAVSYTLGINASPMEPRSILSTDRHVQNSGRAAAGGWNLVTMLSSTMAAWTNDVHRFSGNLLFQDGHVETTDTSELRGALRWRSTDAEHFLSPF